MKKSLALVISSALVIALSGCSGTNTESLDSGSDTLPSGTDIPSSSSSSETVTYLDPKDYLPSTREYIDSVVNEHLQKFQTPDMTDYEKVKAAADYVMSIGFYTVSPGLDVWRWRSADDSMPTYTEMRGLNMLLFGAETCEGYTGALEMLLNAMDIETRNIPGYTYAANGSLVYHTWCQVKIDDVWYHVDCDLEDDISTSRGVVRYKYFLKSDATMGGSHFWGQRLINLRTMEPGQVEEIQAHYMGENCPRDYPTPAANPMKPNDRVDVRAIRNELKQELAEYEKLYGKLEWKELDVVPPVTIKYYLTVEEEPESDPESETERLYGQNIVDFAKTYQNRRCVIKKPGTENDPEYYGRNPFGHNNSNAQSSSEN